MICHRVSSGFPHTHTHKPCHNKWLSDNGTSHQRIPPPTAGPLNIPREGPRGLSTCEKICLEKLLFPAEPLHLKPVQEAPRRASARLHVGLVNKPAACLTLSCGHGISRGMPATPEKNNETQLTCLQPRKTSPDTSPVTAAHPDGQYFLYGTRTKRNICLQHIS